MFVIHLHLNLLGKSPIVFHLFYILCSSQMDFIFVDEDLPGAKENAKRFFRAIGHLGQPQSSLKIGQLHSVEQIEVLLGVR